MPNKNGRKIKISHNKILCTNEFLPLRFTLASAIRILLLSNPTWQQQTSKIKKFNYLEEFKSTTRGH